MQGFGLDATGNLIVAAMTSDLNLVTSSNENLLIYFPTPANSWLWTKTLGSSAAGKILADIKVTSTRVAIIYETSLFVLLSTTDGSVVTSQSHTDMRCNLGCFMLYSSATL